MACVIGRREKHAIFGRLVGIVLFEGQTVPHRANSFIQRQILAWNHVAFKQYNPDKPVKYRILFTSLNNARHCYTYRSFVYADKPTETPSLSYVSVTNNYVKELVESLARKFPLDGRNISMDRLYTSISTAEWLLT